MATPPGPSLLAALPTALRLLRDPRPVLRENTRRYGPIWQSHMPDRGKLKPLVWFMNPAGAERVLAGPYKDDFSWYEGYRFSMEPLFGRDILFLLDDSAEHPAHKARLRALQPAFHPRTDASYFPMIARITEERLARWRSGEEVDLVAELEAITFRVVATLLLGAEEAELDTLKHQFEHIGRGLYTMLPVPLPGTPFRRAAQARREVVDYLLAKIRSPEPPRMVKCLVESKDEQGEPLSETSLVSELVAFLYAGFDTTTSLLVSFWVAVTAQPELVAALREESLAGKEERPLLDATLLETERLYPPLHFALRGVLRDFSFEGFDIRAGSRAAYSAYVSGRNPDVFPDAETFRPDRWLGTRPPPYTVLGFGGGHRPCIGRRFASMEIRLITDLVFRRFDLEVVPDQSDEVYFNPTLQRRHGFRVRPTLRAAVG